MTDQFPSEIYTIAHFENGITIHGDIPEIMKHLLETIFISKFGLNIIDVDIAEKLNADLCYTTKEKSKIWRKFLKIEE